MTIWTALVLIALIAGFVTLMRGRGQTSGDTELIRAEERERELETELIELRERIKVLERIATDEHDTARLRDEIDKLRDD